MSEPLLAVRGVKSFYGNIMALKGVAIDVNEGEIVTLIGANGAGKSTLMMTIFGNPRAREGRRVPARVTRKPEVGRLQSAVAMSSLTILELAVGASGPTTGASFSILKA